MMPGTPSQLMRLICRRRFVCDRLPVKTQIPQFVKSAQIHQAVVDELFAGNGERFKLVQSGDQTHLDFGPVRATNLE